MLTKWWKLELTLATNFGSHAQMVTKFGGQILATKYGFVPDWAVEHESVVRKAPSGWSPYGDGLGTQGVILEYPPSAPVKLTILLTWFNFNLSMDK